MILQGTEVRDTGR